MVAFLESLRHSILAPERKTNENYRNFVAETWEIIFSYHKIRVRCIWSDFCYEMDTMDSRKNKPCIELNWDFRCLSSKFWSFWVSQIDLDAISSPPLKNDKPHKLRWIFGVLKMLSRWDFHKWINRLIKRRIRERTDQNDQFWGK